MELVNDNAAGIPAPNARLAGDSDAALVERVKNGDTAAFDALTLKYRERLFGVVYNMLGNREDAMDIVQDAFFSAFFWHPNVSAESAAAIAAICKNFMVFPIGVLKML